MVRTPSGDEMYATHFPKRRQRKGSFVSQMGASWYRPIAFAAAFISVLSGGVAPAQLKDPAGADAARKAGEAERQRKAARAAETLEMDLAKVTITAPVAAATEDVDVKRDGMPIPR